MGEFAPLPKNELPDQRKRLLALTSHTITAIAIAPTKIISMTRAYKKFVRRSTDASRFGLVPNPLIFLETPFARFVSRQGHKLTRSAPQRRGPPRMT